jgi:hypothetical protein
MEMKHGGPVHYAAFSPDGRRIVTSSVDGVHLWDAASGAPTGVAMNELGEFAEFSPDGTRIAAAGAMGVGVWSADNGAFLGVPYQGQGLANKPQWSADGTRLLVSSALDLFSSGADASGASQKAMPKQAQAPILRGRSSSLPGDAAYIVHAPPAPSARRDAPDFTRADNWLAAHPATLAALIAAIAISSALASRVQAARRHREAGSR